MSRNEKASVGVGSPGSLRLDGCWRAGGVTIVVGVYGWHERKGGDYMFCGSQSMILSRAARNATGLGAAFAIGFSCKKPNVQRYFASH